MRKTNLNGKAILLNSSVLLRIYYVLKASGTLSPGGGSRQIRNEKIGFRLYDIGTITLCGPKVEEYNEKLPDIAQEYKLDQQDQASPVNVSTDERLLNVADDLFGESVAQAEPSVCEIVND